jgi:thioredoxin-like negative regulator of GroEL
MPLPVITDIPTKEKFAEHLQTNPGLLIMKFGATWCGPCKKIEKQVHDCFDKMPDNVQCAIIDIDECFDLYGFLQKKKMINGVPGILAYWKGNLNYIPNDSVVGADPNQVNAFFERCFKKALEIAAV